MTAQLLEHRLPLDFSKAIKDGYNVSQLLDLEEIFYEFDKPGARELLDICQSRYRKDLAAILKSQGILPLPAKFPESPYTTKKSIQYEKRVFVDIKAKKPLGGWIMVGNGLEYDLCGHIYYDEAKGCLNVQGHKKGLIYVRLISATCFRFECPICYQKTCARAAGAIENRFARIPKIGRDQGPEGRVKGLGVPIHVTVSPPEEEAMTLWSDFKNLRKKALKLAKEAGIKGGCMIVHPWRNDIMHEEDYSFIERDKNGDIDLESLDRYYKTLDQYRSFWYKAPHFHLICYGWLDEDKIKEIHDKTGWVIKNHGVRSSVYQTAFYQLSHAGVHPNFHVVTWFGCMSNRTYHQLDPGPKDPMAMYPKCPECGEYLIDLRYDSEDPNMLQGHKEGGYWIDPGGWRPLKPEEINHSLIVSGPGETSPEGIDPIWSSYLSYKKTSEGS